MINLLIIAVIISLVATILGALIALKIQSRVLRRIGIEREAWQNSHEAHQLVWEVKQRRQALDFEQKLTRQVEQIQEAWQRWEAYDKERIAKFTLEQKLARLPHVEDIPISSNGHRPVQQTSLYAANEYPPLFYKANLSGRDLSYRYLGYADLRESQLEGANLYMADLTGAILADANLSAANLAGANLTNADLRGATLTGANLLVADLQNAILNGANLLGAYGLTMSQLNTAISNNNTRFDIETDETLPHVPEIRLTESRSTSTPASVDHSPSQLPMVKSTTP